MAVYIPLGHGGEDVTRPRDIVPEGCSITVIETPGGEHLAEGEEFYEYTQIRNFLRDHADKREIFNDPKRNAKDIIDIFGSVAIFGPGEKYPNLEYKLFLSWDTNLDYTDIRYSGLIPFDTFLNPEFNTRNIISTLPDPEAIGENYMQYTDNNIWLRNNLEIYKYSIYPSPADFTKYFTSIDGRKQLFIDFGSPEYAEKTNEQTINKLDYIAKQAFLGKTRSETLLMLKRNKRDNTKDFIYKERYINVSLKTLMTKFPGNYIHIVCRGRDSSASADYVHAKEEVFTKRIPLMSGNQKRQAIEEIEQSRRNGRKPRFNKYSTKNTSNIMLAGLKRSLVQNQLKNTSNPIILKNPGNTQRPNETKRNKVEYTGRKWATVTTGGRTRRKLYKSRRSRNHR